MINRLSTIKENWIVVVGVGSVIALLWGANLSVRPPAPSYIDITDDIGNCPGAHGDGVSDDTFAIRCHFDLIQSGKLGKLGLMFRRGTYYVSHVKVKIPGYVVYHRQPKGSSAFR